MREVSLTALSEDMLALLGVSPVLGDQAASLHIKPLLALLLDHLHEVRSVD